MSIIRRTTGCLLAGALLAFQWGPTTTSRAVDQINSQSTRPLPSVAPRAIVRPDMQWVPGRYVSVPGEPGGVLVPGHWERVISEREVYVPPLTIFKPDAGAFETVPGGVRPPADTRQGP